MHMRATATFFGRSTTGWTFATGALNSFFGGSRFRTNTLLAATYGTERMLTFGAGSSKAAADKKEGESKKQSSKKEEKEVTMKGHELKLREMLIPKKRKRVYAKIKRGIKRRAREERKLNEKRLKLLETSG
ncbi:unnamed protein product [Gongylonema pulchrum]|uniref:DUF1713 domain-containing protein n=1 Tax=Gongylonema pulchrum TaxID=637853 RepID=A0A183DT40_9BILA|nr:unnamed protein product [Gongylonema pulchrum]